MKPQVCEYHRDGLTISTDRHRLDLDTIHEFLRHAYWCAGVPRDVLAKAIENSLCFGLYDGEKQIGFARVITDYARSANLVDVFVLKPYRGRGYGKWLVQCVVECPLLQGIRSILLGTRDAHGLYAQFGFTPIQSPENVMVLAFDMPWFRPDLIEE